MSMVNELLVDLEVLVAISVILTFVCSIIRYVLIRPINENLNRLTDITMDLRNLMNAISAREQELEIRIMKLEQSLNATNNRIDDLVTSESRYSRSRKDD